MNEAAPQPPDLRGYLIDLESPFDESVTRDYDPVALVRFALTGSTYWAGLAPKWLESGVPAESITEQLRAFEGERHRPQAQRHAARRLRKAVQSSTPQSAAQRERLRRGRPLVAASSAAARSPVRRWQQTAALAVLCQFRPPN